MNMSVYTPQRVTGDRVKLVPVPALLSRSKTPSVRSPRVMTCLASDWPCILLLEWLDLVDYGMVSMCLCDGLDT